MNSRPAFTLLELLISISLAAFIMMGLMQIFQGVVRYLEGTRDIMTINRKACLLFTQLDHDLSTAYIPTLAKEEKAAKTTSKSEQQADDKTTSPELTPEQKKKDEEKEKEKEKEIRKTFFVGLIDERADAIKIDSKKTELCKSISFICTNPIVVYGEKKVRLVRVIYELTIDKAKSTRDLTSYQLTRKETDDLFNTRGKVDEFAPPKPGMAVRSYVVADDVKGFFIEYLMTKVEKDQKGNVTKADKPKEIRSFTWGDSEEKQGIVPEKALVWIEFWHEKKEKSTRFHTQISRLSQEPNPAEKKLDEKEKKTKDAETPADATPAATTPAPQAPDTSGGMPTAPAGGMGT